MSTPVEMSICPTRFTAVYGSHPLHLLTMVSGFALLGYILATFKPATLWNPGSWRQALAVAVHDLLFFPIYALADRVLSARLSGRPARSHPNVLVRNYIRIPALGAGL